ncbi:hypothetical protein Fluta_0398 [Fluviicola taffensis DSM 16823]|uniref:Uncharacterized protein n=2 Tax=Fluviicola TaxID=332102 RepID=F2IE88_FLUTR|nr:hypothetical protein Fluta_0398 [Fluviicola taffensis DSM 16823]
MMRNTFLLIFIFVSSINILYSQEAEKLKKYQSLVSKHTYSKGDTIVVGETGKNVFSAKKKYAGIFIKDKKNVCGFRELDSVISGSQCIIKNILSFQEHCTFEFKNSVVFELQGPNNWTLYMPIDKALQAKELIVFTNPKKTKGIDLLDERAVFLLNLEQSKGTSADNALKYCKIVDPAKGKAFELNLSQFEKEKAEWVKKLDLARKGVQLKDTFILTLPAYLSKYAFDKGEFQIVDNPTVYGSKALTYSGDTKVVFDNYKSFTTLKSAKENADFFLNVNTADYNGNRKAYTQIKAICTSITKDPNVLVTSDNPGINILHFTILEMWMVDSENLNYNYIGSKKLK